MTLTFYLTYAWRSIRRGGQRTALAVTCVAFGVLSLVSLQQLAFLINNALLVSPRVQQSGDIVLTRTGPITGEDIAGLSGLGATKVTAMANAGPMLLKTQRTGRTTIVFSALGVDPATYPLYDQLAVTDGDASTLLRGNAAAIVTRDLASRYQLAVGDTVSIFGSPESAPAVLTVAGIARQTPSRMGLGIYYSIDTARQLGIARVNRVAIRADDPAALAGNLEAAGWKVEVVDVKPNTAPADLFRFMLAGTGILGLLIGGIGVANTMQVLLARRREEIAVLKTIGYGQRHLLAMFGMETAMIGLFGSVIGVTLGVVLAGGFMDLIGRSMPFLLTNELNVGVMLGGILVGILTTLIFGMAAIVRAAGVRPSLLLRDQPIGMGAVTRRAASVGLYTVLLVLFGVLSSVVLGSARNGFGVVGAGLVAFALLGAMLAVVLFLFVRVPAPGFPLVAMARRNLRYQPLRSVFALVALFVGVVSIGFATISIYNASQRRGDRAVDMSGINTRVYAHSDHLQTLQSVITQAEVDSSFSERAIAASIYVAPDSMLPFRSIVGRDTDILTWDLAFADSASAFGYTAGPIIAPGWISAMWARQGGIALGDTLQLVRDNNTVAVQIAGIFRYKGGVLTFGGPPDALVVPTSVVRALAGEQTPVRIHVAVPPDRLEAVTSAIGHAVPESIVIGKDVLADIINGFFSGLYGFAIAVAGLALLAGAVLIANAVGLSMVERRRELGVLKAIGYSSRQVLLTVVLENAMLGFLASAFGIGGLQLVIAVVNWKVPQAALSLTLTQSLALAGVTILFAVVSALTVAWHPTHARPLSVLRSN